MTQAPKLRHYWFPATHGLGIGVTAPDAGTAWFAARAALHRLPPGATLAGAYIEDVDPRSLELGVSRPAPSGEPGVWFPPGHVQPVTIRIARTHEEAKGSFVYVADDGSVRELTAEEAAFLATAFEAADGGRPYVKKHYESRTPDGRLRGFLPRYALPANVTVHSSDSGSP